MDYDKIVFTKEEKTKIKEHIKEIENYIKENIVPILNEGEKIEIDYGGDYWGCRSSYKTTNYHLYIKNEKDYEIMFARKYGNWEKLEKVYENDLFSIIDNWELIKGILNDKKEEKRENRELLKNFRV